MIRSLWRLRDRTDGRLRALAVTRRLSHVSSEGFEFLDTARNFVLQYSKDRGSALHAVLKGSVVLQFVHRQPAPHAPGVKQEGIGINYRILVSEPFAAC